MTRYINFASKILCLAIIVLFFSRYQVLAGNKAALEAENKAEIEAAEEHNKEVQAQILADQGLEEKGYYKDGSYKGEGQGYGGLVEIQIVIENGFVTDITITSAKNEDPVYLEQAENLLEEILKQQSNDVDTVSGATFSSIGIIEAAGDALQKAV